MRILKEDTQIDSKVKMRFIIDDVKEFDSSFFFEVQGWTVNFKKWKLFFI